MNSWDERREPMLAFEPLEADSHEQLTFMQEARARAQRASLTLWLCAGIALAISLALTLTFTLPERASRAYRMGVVGGVFLWPMLAVAVAALWNHRRSQRSYVKIFLIACVLISIVTVLNVANRRGQWQRWLNKTNLTAQDFASQAGQCARVLDLVCEEENWRDYIVLRPDDSLGAANLGRVLNLRDKHPEAVEQFKKALSLGEGAYDLFAYYADSLTKLGQTDQAIEWSYKSLATLPSLVDVRGKLAKLLVGAHRPYEALALLQSYDSQLEARGLPAYFSGQRITIETAIEQDSTSTSTERLALRLPAFSGHYFAPVTIGRSKPKAFMVDTGATKTMISESFLRESNVPYRVTQPDVQIFTADGRKISAKAITIESIAVGRFRLKNVLAVACQECLPLLGQSTLSEFDMQSSKAGGVEFLVLTQRKP